jgi:hypothetical protein
MCTKVLYFSRREARRARRRVPHDGGHLSPYWCWRHQAWHLGNLAPAVIRGFRSRAEVYR